MYAGFSVLVGTTVLLISGVRLSSQIGIPRDNERKGGPMMHYSHVPCRMLSADLAPN